MYSAWAVVEYGVQCSCITCSSGSGTLVSPRSAQSLAERGSSRRCDLSQCCLFRNVDIKLFRKFRNDLVSSHIHGSVTHRT